MRECFKITRNFFLKVALLKYSTIKTISIGKQMKNEISQKEEIMKTFGMKIFEIVFNY